MPCDALSAFPIPSGSVAKVGLVDGAESHARSHGSAVPIAGDVAAKVGVGEYSGPSAVIPLTMDASDTEDDAVRSNSSTLYTCKGTCRTDDGSPCRFERLTAPKPCSVGH